MSSYYPGSGDYGLGGLGGYHGHQNGSQQNRPWMPIYNPDPGFDSFWPGHNYPPWNDHINNPDPGFDPFWPGHKHPPSQWHLLTN